MIFIPPEDIAALKRIAAMDETELRGQIVDYTGSLSVRLAELTSVPVEVYKIEGLRRGVA